MLENLGKINIPSRTNMMMGQISSDYAESRGTLVMASGEYSCLCDMENDEYKSIMILKENHQLLESDKEEAEVLLIHPGWFGFFEKGTKEPSTNLADNKVIGGHSFFKYLESGVSWWVPAYRYTDAGGTYAVMMDLANASEAADDDEDYDEESESFKEQMQRAYQLLALLDIDTISEEGDDD